MSKLKRSLSGVFRGKKEKPGSADGSSVLSSRPDFDIAIPPVIPEETEYSEDLQHVVMDSLRDRIRTLEQERNSSTVVNQHFEKQVKVMDDQIERMNGDFSKLQQEEASRSRQLELHLRTEEQSLKGKDKSILDLEQNLKEYQVLCVNLGTSQKELQEKVEVLESDNHALVQTADSPAVELHRERAELKKEVKSLEAMVLRERGAHQRYRRLFAEIRKEMEKFKAESAERSTNTLKEQQRMHTKEMQELREASQALTDGLTPRTIFIQKMCSQGFGSVEDIVGHQATTFLQSCSPALLTNHLLDVRLDIPQARRFAENTTASDLTLLLCDLCQRPKIARKPNTTTRVQVNEFTRPETSCCSRSICTECYLIALVRTLTNDWWANLSANNWLKCPMPSYNQPLSINHQEGLTNLLRQLGDKDTENNMAMYDRVLSFRAALNELRPPLTDDSLKIASALHKQLVSHGRMNSLFDPAFANKEPDHTGRIPPFKPGIIRMISVDHNETSIQVPLFMRFLRRRKTPQECTICTDELFDLEFGSAREWMDLCADFGGDWMWKILQFPAKLGRECNHEINFCISCLETHLKTQLQQYGRSRCDQLACPADGCGRRLTYDEIRLYATPATFSEYDRYLNLNMLSRLPNFRWCLRPGCSSGQLYDDDDVANALEPHFNCEECAFDMCYIHSMPWHEGQTCEEYDNMRQHGDPGFQQTQQWIARNTKPCPSCQENIQKGEYCFHMTCSNCHFEFCWECLANWNLIMPRNSRHNADAHGEGCPFRTNGLAPTEVSGTNLEEALRRLR